MSASRVFAYMYVSSVAGVKKGRGGGTLGSRGYFFLIDTDGSQRSRVNEAQSAKEKKILAAFFFLALTRL